MSAARLACQRVGGFGCLRTTHGRRGLNVLHQQRLRRLPVGCTCTPPTFGANLSNHAAGISRQQRSPFCRAASLGGEQLHPSSTQEQDTDLKYCYLAQAAYDHGRCRYSLDRMLPALGLGDHGYVATAFLYSAVNIAPVEHHQHWVGYVAVADNAERDRVGYRDIVVVWRGTSALDELFKDLEADLQPIHGEESGSSGKLVRVEHGFQSLYASSCDSNACKKNNNKLSAKDQVLAELRRLVTYLRNRYPGDRIHVTATGHSLGGALAVLNAWDAAAPGALPAPGVVVRAVTFGGPRVGNQAFCDELVGPRGVKVHRVVVDRDVVPSLPPTSFGYADAGNDVRLLHSEAEHGRLPPFFLTLLISWHFHSLKEYLRILDSDYHERPVPVQDPPPAPGDQFLPLPEAELDKRI